MSLDPELPALPECASSAARSAQELMSLQERARSVLAFRRQRDEVFACRLFGEPAWDVLLDLFVREGDERPVSVSAACVASAVPATTALRYLKELEDAGLVRSEESSQDRRCRYVELSARGRELLVEVLAKPI